MKSYLAVLSAFGFIAAQTASAANCGMSQAFSQPNPDSPGSKVAVWADPAGKSLFFIGGLKTNTDGEKRSYNVTDFWGEDTALNNLCNAMDDSCGGLGQDGLRQRRIMTQKARADGWPANDSGQPGSRRTLSRFPAASRARKWTVFWFRPPLSRTAAFRMSAIRLAMSTR